jgi:hypothetical protein
MRDCHIPMADRKVYKLENGVYQVYADDQGIFSVVLADCSDRANCPGANSEGLLQRPRLNNSLRVRWRE